MTAEVEKNWLCRQVKSIGSYRLHRIGNKMLVL